MNSRMPSTHMGSTRPAPRSSRSSLLHTSTIAASRLRLSAKPLLAEAPPAVPAASAQQAQEPQTNNGRKRATLKATRVGQQAIQEKAKPLADYMSLPASQYSVLDARRIERVDETTFRCYVGQLRFFSWSVEPVLTVSVEVEPGLGCTISLRSCKLQGSPFVEQINDRFSATMSNVVRYRDRTRDMAAVDSDEEPDAGQKEIVSQTSIQVDLEVPPWSSFVPVDSIETMGSSVMQGVLNAMVPRFLAQLRTDYERWAAGDDSRKPVGEI